MVDLREAEARARIVGETAADVFSGPRALSATLDAIASSTRTALGAREVAIAVCSEDGATVAAVHRVGDPGAAPARTTWGTGRVAPGLGGARRVGRLGAAASPTGRAAPG